MSDELVRSGHHISRGGRVRIRITSFLTILSVCPFFFSFKISALVLRAQASEILLEELQQGFSQAKRDVQEQMVS